MQIVQGRGSKGEREYMVLSDSVICAVEEIASFSFTMTKNSGGSVSSLAKR